MLRCVVELAHTLGLRVIGEGVETIAQLDLLCSLGCDEFQGFLLGRPSFDVVSSASAEIRIVESTITYLEPALLRTCGNTPGEFA